MDFRLEFPRHFFFFFISFCSCAPDAHRKIYSIFAAFSNYERCLLQLPASEWLRAEMMCEIQRNIYDFRSWTQLSNGHGSHLPHSLGPGQIKMNFDWAPLKVKRNAWRFLSVSYLKWKSRSQCHNRSGIISVRLKHKLKMSTFLWLFRGILFRKDNPKATHLTHSLHGHTRSHIASILGN